MHRKSGGGLGVGVEALFGVFTPTDGALTVPVYVNDAGQAFMRDPNSADAFKQAMNNYHSAKLGLYSEQADSMHHVLFGGITLSYFDESTQSFVQDNNMPFTSQVTQVNVDSSGAYSQDLIGQFPALLDQAGKRMLFGSGAEFFLADGIPTYDNGVIKLDDLTGPTVLGYIYGGIFANAPHAARRARRGERRVQRNLRSRLHAGAGADGAVFVALAPACLSSRRARPDFVSRVFNPWPSAKLGHWLKNL